MNSLANHLWQSTLFAAVAAFAAVVLRRNSANVRHAIWLAASIKFLLPFTWLVGLVETQDLHSAAPVFRATTVQQITTSFAPGAPVAAVPSSASVPWLQILLALWLAGTLALLYRWLVRWQRLRLVRRHATPLAVMWAAPVLATDALLEPGVFGVLRPVLLLPHGIGANLDPEQLDAILAHERCHLARRDNLTAALHMIVEAVFWFHPLVWFIGAKLIEERERACDEAVLRDGNEPAVYAQSIVNVCRLYAPSPLPCASGVTGADLKRRIREIMLRPEIRPLSMVRKTVICLAATIILATPVAIGFLRAQTLPPAPQYTYEVVSIKPSDPDARGTRIGPGPSGGLRTQNTSVMMLLTFAYDVRDYQISGGPSWVRDQRFDVMFTPDKTEVIDMQKLSRDAAEQMFSRQRQRMQAVLRDRFGLVLRAETHEMPIYALTIAKGGPKLTPSTGEKGERKGPSLSTTRDNEGVKMTGVGVYFSMITPTMAGMLGRYVVNETGLDGPYDFELKWTPSDGPQDSDQVGPSVFTAVTEQLGLKLEGKKGPVPVYVIEKIQKPTDN